MKFKWTSFFLTASLLTAQPFEFQGQASVWGILNYAENGQAATGARYLPQISAELPLSGVWTLEGELTEQATWTHQYTGHEVRSDGTHISAYRAWIRLASHQFEMRAGLQKINFGSARLFRPLMWFDRLDPRDPLQLTDGVYALLCKYTMLDNTNFWFWTLIGNDGTKGWEVLPTREGLPEWGGRIQRHAGPGEIAVSGHYRHTDTDQLAALSALSVTGTFTGFSVPGRTASESRLALDGRWDITAGVWFEMAAVRQNWASPFQHQVMGTAGLDYTFGFGDGLFAQLEQFTWQSGWGWNGMQSLANFSAVSLNYPVSIFENLSLIVYHDWDRNNWYRLANWRHTTDHLELHLITFWNPEEMRLFQMQGSASVFTGKGIQCMIVFNH